MVNRMITNGKLKPDALRDGTPLCAHQYNLIFGTTRLPAAPKDRVYVCKSEHIAVLWAGHVFCLNVFNDDGTHLSPADMFVQLQRIKVICKPCPYPCPCCPCSSTVCCCLCSPTPRPTRGSLLVHPGGRTCPGKSGLQCGRVC